MVDHTVSGMVKLLAVHSPCDDEPFSGFLTPAPYGTVQVSRWSILVWSQRPFPQFDYDSSLFGSHCILLSVEKVKRNSDNFNKVFWKYHRSIGFAPFVLFRPSVLPLCRRRRLDCFPYQSRPCFQLGRSAKWLQCRIAFCFACSCVGYTSVTCISHPCSSETSA